MAALESGKIYTPSSAEEVRDDFLTDWRLEARKSGSDDDTIDRATRPGGDIEILGTALGNLALLQYANIAQADIDSDILTATGDKLDEKRIGLGLPEVPASPSSGRIVTLVGAVLNSHEFVLPNGKRGKVDGVQTADVNGEVPVVTIDTGADCNLEANQQVNFVSPPPGVPVAAKVSVNAPLTGGADAETDERKRDRILNRLQNVPAGGNWGFLVEKSLNALATVQQAFVYPALGGPSSVKVTLTKDIDPDAFDFKRYLTSSAVTIVRDALHAVVPEGVEVVVGSVAQQNTDVALLIDIPNSTQAGGNGKGWIDFVQWPPLTGGETKITISSVTDNTHINTAAATAVSPVAGQTHIAWWSSVDQKFVIALVVAVAGGAGAWQLTLDTPLVDHNGALPTANEYLSPAAVNIVEYGKTWRTSMRRSGPGENTADPNRLPRAERHPLISEGWPSDLTVRQLTDFIDAHPEISDASWSYRSVTTPTVPGSVSTDPNILVPRHFGVYPS